MYARPLDGLLDWQKQRMFQLQTQSRQAEKRSKLLNKPGVCKCIRCGESIVLGEYKRKRDFQRTPEPAAFGDVPPTGQLLFVIQKHAARRLHYDLRLELAGVFVSWAVPKGPSLNPHDKHLAIKVEDHPYLYKDFEGIIPSGEYGAGEVIIWDQGIYFPCIANRPVIADKKPMEQAVRRGLAAGRLSVL